MPNKSFLVRLTSRALQQVRATTVEVHGNHVVFLTEKGRLAGAFLLDLVESSNGNFSGTDGISPNERRVHTGADSDMAPHLMVSAPFQRRV
jgi:hypothetical protein